MTYRYILRRDSTGDTIVVPPAALHRTLLTMHCGGQTDDAVARAMADRALVESGTEVRGTYRNEPVTLTPVPATLATVEDDTAARLVVPRRED